MSQLQGGEESLNILNSSENEIFKLEAREVVHRSGQIILQGF